MKGFQPGENHWRWSGDDASHFAQIDRCIKARGRASEHKCFMCLYAQAYDWAHIHGMSGLELVHFIPLCRSCHLRYDNTEERNEKKSRALKGKPWSEARRAAHKPWHQSDEAKAKISAARRSKTS